MNRSDRHSRGERVAFRIRVFDRSWTLSTSASSLLPRGHEECTNPPSESRPGRPQDIYCCGNCRRAFSIVRPVAGINRSTQEPHPKSSPSGRCTEERVSSPVSVCQRTFPPLKSLTFSASLGCGCLVSVSASLYAPQSRPC